MEEALRARMEQVLANTRQDVGTIRTGRATPSLVEDIAILAYGGQQRLRLIELATITAPDPQSLLISPWDRSIVGEIKKGIETAKTGLTPIIAGEDIRINLPPLTQEDRQSYIRLLHQKLEVSRIAVRQVRQDGMHDAKRQHEAKEISEDELFAAEKRIQAATDEYIGRIDELGRAKESELRSL